MTTRTSKLRHIITTAQCALALGRLTGCVMKLAELARGFQGVKWNLQHDAFLFLCPSCHGTRKALASLVNGRNPP